MIAPKITDHLLRLQDTQGFVSAFILQCANRPQMFGTSQSAGPVRQRQTIDHLWPLRINAHDQRRLSVRADDSIARLETTHRAPTRRSQYAAVQRLRPPTHEGQWGDFYDALLQEPRGALVIDQVEERVVKRPQVRVNLVLQIARKETKLLSRFKRRAGQHDA